MRFASTDPTPIRSRVGDFLRGCVRVDTRALAAFRILVATLLLVDLGLRSRNLARYYAESGAVSRSLARAAAPVDAPSLYALSSDPAAVAALFAVNAAVALLLLVGYRTRLATVLSLVFAVSLALRNPLVLSYADALLWWLLCWGVFLPLGERWSVDAVRADPAPRRAVANPASALLLLQMVAMYWVNAAHKAASDLWWRGEAAVLILGLDDTTFLLADLARSAPSLLRIGGLAWFAMLALAWLLLPARGRARTAGVALFVAGHLAFALTVRIGAFPFVAVAGLLPFLPPSFWDDLGALSRRPSLPLADVAARLEAAAAAVPYPRLPVDPGPWLDRNREEGALTVVVAVVSLVLLVSLLSAGGVVDDAEPVAGAERGAAAVVDHQTDWTIFAPNPRTTDRYYVVTGTTGDGERVDVRGSDDALLDPPVDLHEQYDTYRDRFYFESVRADRPSGVRSELAGYHCRTWADDDLARLELYASESTVTRATLSEPSARDWTVTRLGAYDCTEGGAVAASP